MVKLRITKKLNKKKISHLNRFMSKVYKVRIKNDEK